MYNHNGPKHRTMEEFEQDYAQLLKQYGKTSRKIAAMFQEEYNKGTCIEDVPYVILQAGVKEEPGDHLLARHVNAYMKAHPAIMESRYLGGNVNTFIPFQLAGILCLVQDATGKEPEIADYPIRDVEDLETISKFAYLWCYSPTAYKSLVGGGENK